MGGASPGARRCFCTASLWRNCAAARMKSESISAAIRLTFAYHHTGAAEYPLLPTEEIVTQAQRCAQQGVARFSIVTSGKRLREEEVERMCRAVREIRERAGIAVCVSFGLLRRDQYRQLREAGVTRIHNNLETSQRYFPSVCTTHTFDDKVAAIRAAQAEGLSVCSGGIMGLGETPTDRIDMALTLRELGIQSVPLNMLNPIPGTPLAQNQRLTAGDLRRIPLPSPTRLSPPCWRPGAAGRQRGELFFVGGECGDYRGYADHVGHHGRSRFTAAQKIGIQGG